MWAIKCRSLVLQGEALSRCGDFRSAVDKFQEALKSGTHDPSVLSAIYVHLGNAYFSLENYDKALEFHTQHMRIARETGDTRGEIEASGNIAMSLKCLGQYKEAIACGQRQLELYRAKGDDSVGKSQALFTLGSIHLAKATAMIQKADKVPREATEHLDLAVGYYRENHNLVNLFLLTLLSWSK